MMTTETDNMGLILPDVSTSRSYGTFARSWAGYVSGNLFKIDNHNHTNGRGAKIPWSSLKKEGLDLNQFGVINIPDVGLKESSEGDIPVDALYSDGENLFWKNSEGVSVQITESGSLPSDTTGGFTGDYTVDGSKASFLGPDGSFRFYGANSSSYADIGASSISGVDIVVNTLDSLVEITGSSEFETMANYGPDIQANTWKRWYDTNYSTLTSELTYPFFVKRDYMGGVSVPADTGTIHKTNEFSGNSSIGYSSYFNTPDKKGFYYKVECEAYEQPTKENGWTLFNPGKASLNSQAYKDFVINENRTYTGNYTSMNVLGRKLMFYYTVPSQYRPRQSKYMTFPGYELIEGFDGSKTTVTVRFEGSRLGDPQILRIYATEKVTGSVEEIEVIPYVALVSLKRYTIDDN